MLRPVVSGVGGRGDLPCAERYFFDDCWLNYFFAGEDSPSYCIRSPLLHIRHETALH
jgi:hypothetical protein